MDLKKFRKISRIVGWTIIGFFLLIYLLYKISPDTFLNLGIDFHLLARYTIAFFIIKGCITTSIILYGAWMLRKKLKK